MPYPMRRTLTLSLIWLLVSLLPACGKKGPLYLPQEDKPAAPVAAPAVAPFPPPAATPP